MNEIDPNIERSRLLQDYLWFSVDNVKATEAEIRQSFELKWGRPPQLCFFHNGLWYAGPEGKYTPPSLARFCHKDWEGVAL